MTPPWKAWKESLQKPPQSEYGYYKEDKPYTCSREQLIEACENGITNLVWTPDSPTLLITSEVPFLFDLHKKKAIRDAWWGIGLSLSLFLILSAILLSLDERPSLGSGRLFYPTLFLLGFFWSIHELIQVRKLTPQEIASSAPQSWYSLWLSLQSCSHTWLLVSAIAFIAFMEVVAGLMGSDPFGSAGLSREKVLEGEVWRLVTAPMLHASPSHLYWNLTALYFVGRILEAHGKQRWMVAVFTVTAVVGGLFSLALPPDKISVGASGGILGLEGFLGVLAWRNEQELPPGFLKRLLIGIGMTALIGFVGFKFIDNAAHLGGLLAGIGMGLWLIPDRSESSAQAVGS